MKHQYAAWRTQANVVASEQPPTFTSAAELMAVGMAAEREAAVHYGDCAATMAAAGNTEAAATLRWLQLEKQNHGETLARRAVELGLAPRAVAPQAAVVPTLDQMADEDLYTVTAHRMLAIAVRNEQRAFAYFAYVAAHAADPELRQLAEDLAHERLGHAATLRRERRKAWRRVRRGHGCRPLPQSHCELRSLASRLEGSMAARHGALAEAATALGDLASAEVLRSVAAEAAGLFPAARAAAPTANALPQAPAGGTYDLLRAALVDLEDAYDIYLGAAEGRAGEEAMKDAQRWAASALRRSGLIRARLTDFRKARQS
jgi:rubrerythrin